MWTFTEPQLTCGNCYSLGSGNITAGTDLRCCQWWLYYYRVTPWFSQSKRLGDDFIVGLEYLCMGEISNRRWCFFLAKKVTMEMRVSLIRAGGLGARKAANLGTATQGHVAVSIFYVFMLSLHISLRVGHSSVRSYELEAETLVWCAEGQQDSC